MSHQILLVSIIVAVALGFDFTNGMHDSANSVATIVATRVLTPMQAVVWAAFWNIAAFFLFGTAVAKTIGSGMIDVHSVTPFVVLAALLGAIGWNILTLSLGIPTSSSHAIIGAYAGAAIAKAGFGVLLAGGWTKTLLFIVIAPLIGFFLGGLLLVITSWILEWANSSPSRVAPWLKSVRLLSAAAYSLGHGGKDDGYHHGSSLFREADSRISHSLVGCSFSLRSDGARNALRRMEDHENHGAWHCKTSVPRRFLRRTCERCQHLSFHPAGHPGQHDACDHRRHLGHPGGESRFRCALEYGVQHRVGLGFHHSRRRCSCMGAVPIRSALWNPLLTEFT